MDRKHAYVEVLAALVLGGCASSGEVVVRQTTYQQWDGCWTLTDGTTEAVIVPQVGRILRYGRVGGPNLLWTNPDLPGPIRPDEKGWHNYGGDKIWPWPEAQWPDLAGRTWPPPGDVKGTVHEAKQVDATTVRLTSPVLPGYKLCIVRDISMSADDGAVTITSWFEPVDDRPADVPWPEVWSVTQTSPPDGLCVRVTGDPSPGTFHRNMNHGEWTIRQGASLALQWLTPPSDTQAKIGVRADAIAAVLGQEVFVQQFISKCPSTLTRPTERAQIYAEPDSSNEPNPMAYWELEFLGGVHNGTPAPLTVRWRLGKLSPGELQEHVESMLTDLPTD